MLGSAIGGACVALVVVSLSLLVRSARREPKPRWLGNEFVEGSIACGLVALLAVGFALVLISATKGGLADLAVGVGVPVIGSMLAIKAAR